MKKFLVLILSLIVALLCVGCGTYTPAEWDPGSNVVNGGKPKPGPGDDDPGPGGNPNVDPEAPFTVTLIAENGTIFIPTVTVTVLWTEVNTGAVRDQVVDENGKASITGLDGEYHVTLDGLGKNYTYDPNNYMADNDNRDIEVKILRILSPASGSGSDKYSPYKLKQAGTYRATIRSRTSSKVWYQYEPTASGWYVIQSWVDTTANEVNPIMYYYLGTFAWIPDRPTEVHDEDEGAASSTYTKNFRFNVQVGESFVGNVWTFQLVADCRSGTYPVTVDFTIEYIGEYIADDPDHYPSKPANGPFLLESHPGQSFRYNYLDTNRAMDGSRVRFNEKGGYYEIDVNGEYRKLYAMLTKDAEVWGADGTESKSGFMDYYVYWRLKFDGWNWINFMDRYASYCNATDGTHMVTKELKEFLQGYACSQRLFFDGEGQAEDPFGANLRSSEEDQWLSFCGYYI